MNISSILEICKMYSKLGWACQEQLHIMIDNGNLSGLNGNAVRYNLEFLDNVKSYMEDADIEELDDIITDFQSQIDETKLMQ
jgi:hypothetical protein